MTAVYRSLDEIPAGFGPSVAAIGNFDGVHRGHRENLDAVTAEARARGLRSAAITFDPHPEQFLRPQQAPGLLTPMDHRIRLLAATGVDAILILRFDEAIASLSGRQFVEQILVGRLGVRALHEGGNFRFGHKADSGVSELISFGREFGFTLTVHRAVHVHGMEVSSSAVRELVARGDMKRARWMLGRPFSVSSTPRRDRGVGTRLLVPTVNLAPYTGMLPAFGIYVTRMTIADRCFQAVSSIGNRPTFPGAGFSVETHILNFEPVDLTDETPVELEFLFRLRDEKKFDSIEELKAEIMKDVARARRYFRRAGS
ncbi:MAG TPA: bifunctional riboflavin kinase/FAD synthetase [Terracidiphilus sp.]|jgi:riboflavin kinase/FMN adenylyltransferase|nr:bifunctional riboflavin kinase/FAD synthetase [Terracidiphilus sp.]